MQTGPPKRRAGRSRCSAPALTSQRKSVARSCSRATGYYDYADGTQPDVSRTARSSPAHRASPAVARGSRLCGQERRGDRQWGHGRDAHPGDGRAGRAHHHAAALAVVCDGHTETGSDSQRAAREIARQAGLPDHPRYSTSAVSSCLLHGTAPSRPGAQVHPRACGRGAARRLRRGHPFQPAIQAVGPAAVLGARRRPVHGDPRRQSIGGDRPVDRFTETGILLDSGEISKPTSSSPQPV